MYVAPIIDVNIFAGHFDPAIGAEERR